MNSARPGPPPDLDAWAPWTPDEVSARLAGTGIEWHVVGGWAIDLFLERQTREHADIEIAVLRKDVPALLRQLTPHRIYRAGSGQIWPFVPDDPVSDDPYQYWVCDETARAWRLDVMADPGNPDEWVYRRDHRVRAPRSTMVTRPAGGIPYLRPHGAILFKAKRCDAKDEADFAAVVGEMSAGERRWLTDALALTQPEHPWTLRLPQS